MCGKVLGDFVRSVLHHHRAVADPDHAIFGNEHGAEQDPGMRPDADRSTHHRGGRHAGAGVNPRCLAVPPAGPGLPRMLGRTLRHAFITAALDAGVPLRDVQEAASHADPRTTMRYDRACTSLDRQPLNRRRLCRRSSPVSAASEPSAWPPHGQADDRAAPPRLSAVTAREPPYGCHRHGWG